MTNRAFAGLAGLLILTASAAQAAPPAPDYARIAGEPASPHGKAYADCIAQATAAGTYDQTSRKDGHLLRFHCAGDPAKVLYDALGPWSAAQHSEWSAAGRTWRSTGKIEHDLFGTDYCSSDGAADYACDVTLNVGAFLAGEGRRRRRSDGDSLRDLTVWRSRAAPESVTMAHRSSTGQKNETEPLAMVAPGL